MRLALAMVLGLTSCAAVEPCRTADVELWCWHDEQARGPVIPDSVTDPTCASPVPSDQAQEHCGWLVDDSGPDLSGVRHVFDAATGEHVSTVYWTDVSIYCDGFEYTYGRRVDDCR